MLDYILLGIEFFVLLYLIFSLLNKKEKYFRALLLFNVAILSWIISILAITFIKDISISLLLARLTFTATAIAVLSYCTFFIKYIKYPGKIIPKIINVSGLVLAILAQTPLIIKSMELVEGSNYPKVVFANFALLYILYVVFSVAFLIYLIIKLRKKSMGLEYLQISYISFGMVIAGVLAIFTNVIFPIITGNSSSTFWGPVAVGIFGAITTYTITRHRLFGLKYLLERFLYYSLSIMPPYFLGLLFFYIARSIGLDSSKTSTYLIILGITIVSITFYSFFRKYLDKKFSPRLGSVEGDIDEIKTGFLKSISTELDINKLGVLTLSTIDKIFDLKKSGIIIFNGDNGSIIYKKLYEFGEQLVDNQNLLQVIYYWRNIGHSTTITRDELSNKKNLNQQEKRILHFMEKDGIEIVLPLNRKVHLNGVVIIGSKNSRNPFTVEDINYLEALIINSSVAFSRSILYSQVQEFNVSLQQKVNEQTEQLRVKVEQLEEARRKEADMIDIMGHELRTPATVVKLNVSLLEKFIESNPKDFKKYIDRISQAVDTEIELINTLLTSAKLEGNKIEIKHQKVDVKEEIEMSIHGHEGELTKDTKMVSNIPNDLPYAYADRVRVAEVLNNLISNAVKYTEKGQVTVTAKANEKNVVISIKDTGQGISKEDLEKLGEKFYRIDNYLESQIVRPGGTGLGLYITFGLVKLMGGNIHVNSEVGKGSIFTITLPKYTGQHIEQTKDSIDRFEKLGLKK
jgi:signal transduction histidine kinase